MKYLLVAFIALFVFTSNAQNKVLVKHVKDAGKYSKDVLTYAENLYENIEDALDAVNYEEARFYVEQSVYELENLQASTTYVQDELLEISKIDDDNGGVDIKLKSGKVEDKCLLIQTYSNTLFTYLNNALLTATIADLLMQFGAAKNTCDNIISETQRVIQLEDELLKMIVPPK
ncbi:MAG: hypothetical protein HOD63_17645 [Bacteroidetes bacterium]|jgi:hypothetical protein|nr:hypothetical protein [Bacteroidota bacterium]MBT5530566.1 hypothetical protein [Cytophagia bacterium]MBT3423539.1 hypothetical protein [Bacteroidota bacterium]MBT3935618.1 hypothetical protein [Bacteroidota bacterium]MBT4340418.1 hypothetical protein [Bacteroidota bacterium]